MIRVMFNTSYRECGILTSYWGHPSCHIPEVRATFSSSGAVTRVGGSEDHSYGGIKNMAVSLKLCVHSYYMAFNELVCGSNKRPFLK
jgi:hypothetical protein